MSKKAIILFIVLITLLQGSYNETYAEINIDSLKTLIRESSGHTKLDHINKLAEKFYGTGNNIDDYSNLTDEYFRLADSLDSEEGIANAYRHSGRIFFYSNDFEKAKITVGLVRNYKEFTINTLSKLL